MRVLSSNALNHSTGKHAYLTRFSSLNTGLDAQSFNEYRS